MDITKKIFSALFIIGVFFASPVFAATDTSSNWGGYVAQNGTYTGVSGTFVMPELSYSSSLVSNATWVGIGGHITPDLIQAGVYEIADANGATYQAWYELLPDDSVPIDLLVRPGDSVSVAILETSTDVWSIVITNDTTKQQFAKTVQYHSLHSSAEWIQERPQVNGTLPPLSGFTPVKFTNAYAVENGKRLPLNQMNPISVSLLDTQPNSALAVPSMVGADNTSFTVFRTSAIASAATPIASHVPQYLLRRTGQDIFPSIPGLNWTVLFETR